MLQTSCLHLFLNEVTSVGSYAISGTLKAILLCLQAAAACSIVATFSKKTYL
jgi:hypothetical protein